MGAATAKSFHPTLFHRLSRPVSCWCPPSSRRVLWVAKTPSAVRLLALWRFSEGRPRRGIGCVSWGGASFLRWRVDGISRLRTSRSGISWWCSSGSPGGHGSRTVTDSYGCAYAACGVAGAEPLSSSRLPPSWSGTAMGSAPIGVGRAGPTVAGRGSIAKCGSWSTTCGTRILPGANRASRPSGARSASR